jgi:transposase InsO family protein
MPWTELSIVSQRQEFVVLASAPGANIRDLCRRFGISPKTGYKWIDRADQEGGLNDRSRRPRRSPDRTAEAIEKLVLELRDQHPVWGGRKLRARLLELGHKNIPAASTITEILRRHGRITPEASEAAKRWIRFEHEQPNDLWQMDFKGPVQMRRGLSHPLTIIDDHSRYCVGLYSCGDQQRPTVERCLTQTFRRYGLPWRILADNGPPWGRDSSQGAMPWTLLKVWLLKLGVVTIHGRPYHPQTQGKDERFHRTLKAELLARADLHDHADAQKAMDGWRRVYDLERPHESAALKPPVSRYRPSERAFPEKLPVIEPSPGHTPRVIKEGGYLRWAGQRWYIGSAWNQETMGLKESTTDGHCEVYFGPYLIAELNLRAKDGDRVRLVPLGRCAPSLHDPHTVS